MHVERWLLVSVVGSALACSPAGVEPSPSIETPLIYGEDDRVDAYLVEDGTLRDIARQTAVAMVADSALEPVPAGGFTLVADSLRESANVCPSERFAEQPAAARCSGVLVDDDLVLTAGHCATKIASCAEQVWVFNYALGAPGAMRTISDEDVYRCKSIPFSVDQQDAQGRRYDFAFVELDRPTRPPLQPARLTARDVARGESLCVVGYPSGLPVKIDCGGTVLDSRTTTRDYFTLTSDTFDRSSGSGVFDASGQLAGVFVRGEPDYVLDVERNCFVARHIPQGDRDHAEEASYAARAAGCLCHAGWGSERLCSPSQGIGSATDDAGCAEHTEPPFAARIYAGGGCNVALAMDDAPLNAPRWAALFALCWLRKRRPGR